jgi:hypothetical protein
MRSTIALVALATVLAGCSLMPFGDENGDELVTAAPTPAAAQAPAAAPATGTAQPLAITHQFNEPQVYEIKKADRGLVRRVKVLLNGRTVDTLVMSRTRETASSYCCTADGCQEIEEAKACTTFKMTCDKDGACKALSSGGSSRL